MAMKDKVNDKGVRHIYSGTVSGMADEKIDRLGFGALTVLVRYDDKSTSATATVSFEDCETDTGDFVAVEAVNTIIPESNPTGVLSASHAVDRFGYLGDKRYVKPKITLSTGASSEEVHIYAILEDPMVTPTN